MGDYIETAWIIHSYITSTPNQYNNKYYCQYWDFFLLVFSIWRLECKVDILQTEHVEYRVVVSAATVSEYFEIIIIDWLSTSITQIVCYDGKVKYKLKV